MALLFTLCCSLCSVWLRLSLQLLRTGVVSTLHIYWCITHYSTKTYLLITSCIYYVTVSISQESGHSWPGPSFSVSYKLKWRCCPSWNLAWGLDWGRICSQVHRVVGSIKFLMDWETEGLSSKMAVGWKPPSGSCQVGPCSMAVCITKA